MPDATSLHHCLKNKQLKLKAFSGKDPAKILSRGVAITCIPLEKCLAIPTSPFFHLLVNCFCVIYKQSNKQMNE